MDKTILALLIQGLDEKEIDLPNYDYDGAGNLVHSFKGNLDFSGSGDSICVNADVVIKKSEYDEIARIFSIDIQSVIVEESLYFPNENQKRSIENQIRAIIY